MWNCPKCHETIDDEYEICWNCGTTRDGVEDPAFERSDPKMTDEINAALPADDLEKTKEIDELRYGLKRTRALLKVLSFLSVLMSMYMAFFVYSAWRYYIYRQTEMELGGIGAILSIGISLEEIFQYGAAAFVLAFWAYASFLWSYSRGISEVLNAGSISLNAVLSLQVRFWRRIATTSEIAVVLAVIIALYVHYALN